MPLDRDADLAALATLPPGLLASLAHLAHQSGTTLAALVEDWVAIQAEWIDYQAEAAGQDDEGSGALTRKGDDA